MENVHNESNTNVTQEKRDERRRKEEREGGEDRQEKGKDRTEI